MTRTTQSVAFPANRIYNKGLGTWNKAFAFELNTSNGMDWLEVSQ